MRIELKFVPAVKSYRKKETAEDEMEYYERELEKLVNSVENPSLW